MKQLDLGIYTALFNLFSQPFDSLQNTGLPRIEQDVAYNFLGYFLVKVYGVIDTTIYVSILIIANNSFKSRFLFDCTTHCEKLSLTIDYLFLS